MATWMVDLKDFGKVKVEGFSRWDAVKAAAKKLDLGAVPLVYLYSLASVKKVGAEGRQKQFNFGE